MKCSTHSCSYRVFIVTVTPPIQVFIGSLLIIDIHYYRCLPPPRPIAEVSVKQSPVSGWAHNSPCVCKFRKTEVRSAFLTIMDIAFALSIFYHYAPPVVP